MAADFANSSSFVATSSLGILLQEQGEESEEEEDSEDSGSSEEASATEVSEQVQMASLRSFRPLRCCTLRAHRLKNQTGVRSNLERPAALRSVSEIFLFTFHEHQRLSAAAAFVGWDLVMSV